MTNPPLQREIEEAVSEFRKAVYEPVHLETTCWCKPKFLNKDGVLHIEHNEQRDILSQILRQNLTRVLDEVGKEIKTKMQPEKDIHLTERRKLLNGGYNQALTDILSLLEDMRKDV